MNEAGLTSDQAYINTIFYLEVLAYIFDADTIFLRQIYECIDNKQRFSYAAYAMIQLMQCWTVDESSIAPSHVLENAARAMSRVRTSLIHEKTTTDDTLLLELTGLASVTVSQGLRGRVLTVDADLLQHLLQHHEAFKLHCKMLLKIVKERGGFGALENVHLAQIICKM